MTGTPRLPRLCGIMFVLLAIAPAMASERSSPRSRSVEFTYAATLTQLTPQEMVRVWLPVPPDNDDQHMVIVHQDVPTQAQIGTEPANGNRIVYFQSPARPDGSLSLAITYQVTRHEISESPTPSGIATDRYLKPDRLVPIGGKPLTLLTGRRLPSDGLPLGRFLYDLVDDHLQYRKDRPGWGRGDAEWACDSGFGNCTDFHSLFISLARSQHLPAKFEIGFALPEQYGSRPITSYHCWAKFLPPGHGWVPVDIAQASQDPARRDYCFGHLSENRVAFSTGRDLALTPKQDGPPLNFFIYPYAETNGKPLPPAQVQTHFSYRDVPGDY